jgi:RNA polymerase sigma-70 factor (ECF subfamily)
LNQQVPQLIDNLFRRHAGQLVSTLTRILGPANLDLAEDAVQDSLIKALELWPFHGIPDNPAAWLIQVAKNRALDRLRRDARAARLTDVFASQPIETQLFPDDQLSMMFLCAHPAIAEEARLALTLKTVGGFGTREIARAFLAEETAISQRIVRAKRQIRDQRLEFAMPGEADLGARLDSVLSVLYLMFNEGYGALRRDLCEEAIRLARMIAENRSTACPRSHALLALFLLQASRLAARLDAQGALLLIDQQDRAQWNRDYIQDGARWLDRSATGEQISAYHLEAEIAAAHIADRVDWAYIADLYEQLQRLKPTPVVALNLAVAIARRDGPRAGIAAVERIADHPSLRMYYLLPAVLGSLWRELGNEQKAREYYHKAAQCPCSDVERRFLKEQLGKEEAGAFLGEKG